ncbi:unnamed protein product [Lymnaea stagnalis]|uniref:Ig-like domain-containing protein n=1 Tax=Lymnaea stagnalis TaxID=6523 RepID=A0AAV2H9J1_LYMST
MKSLQCILIQMLLVVQSAALPPCSFKQGIGIRMTCDVSQQNVTSLQWRVGGLRSEISPHLTTCDMHGCDKQNYEGTHTFLATVQLDPTSTRIVNSSLRLPGDPFFSYFVGDYDCVPDGGQAIRICDDLSYYDDPTPPVCGPPIVADEIVKLTCKIDNVYPDPQCRIILASNGQVRNIATGVVAESSQMGVNPDNMSFSAVCNVSIPLRDLGVGDHVFQLVASVNFNDTELAQVYSNNVSLIISNAPQKPNCMYPVINSISKNIILECYTSYVHPALGCEMAAFKNNIPLVRQANVSYINDVALYQAKNIFVSKCYFSIPLSRIGPGSFEFRVTMYTDDNNATDINRTRITGDLTSPLLLKIPTLKDLSQRCPVQADFTRSHKTTECQCLLDEVGNPPGSVQWRSSNGLVPQQRTVWLDLDDFKANETFTCKPQTPIADDLPGYTWAPVWQGPPVVANFTANGKERELQAGLNTRVTLDCRLGGAPLHTVVITKGVFNYPVPTNGTSYYVFHVKECTDSATYTCLALNTIETTIDSKTLHISVNCPLQFLDKTVLPITVKSNVKGHVDVHLHIVGYPKPTTFLLVKKNHNSREDLMYSNDFYVEYSFSEDHTMDLVLTVRGVWNTANYTFTVGNGLGQPLDVDISISIPEDESSDVNIGAVVGGVMGGLAAIVFVVFFSYWILRKRKNRRSNEANHEDNIHISRMLAEQNGINVRI